ncbi:MAG TPA: malto-oligosyltrehalose trehalohydrolase [Mycobacteriales bacterium]|nr:malto-oligosyltrehalose trehalohydrolase [Mycobacteriales bacterium]
MSSDGTRSLPLGASRTGPQQWTFVVWAPFADRVDTAVIADGACATRPMRAAADGYFVTEVDSLAEPPAYRFVLDGRRELADPASRWQPSGVFGPSRGFDPEGFAWTDDDFTATPLSDAVIYELHVGTFTAAGTFDAAIDRLDDLVALGVTAVEPMPINAFPGERNWGYDGAFPFAVQDSYGGPTGFQRFVDSCHAKGLAVYLDVVYNHLGPEGVVHREYGPYFTEAYTTPWGAAMNFSEAGSDEVRRYFCDNAVMWCRDFHVDGLRADAIHGIVDPTASPFLRELTDAVHAVGAARGREVVMIAESADNNPSVVVPARDGGLGFDAQWNDDFHHALHAVLTGERDGYYADFGGLGLLERSLRDGFAFRGEYSVFRGRRHGSLVGSVANQQLVCYTQDHDQVGNRAGAERLSALVGLPKARLAAAVLLLSPFVPMLFMGEEYAEQAPFPYFVDHSDPALLRAVREGRAEEFGREADRLDPGAEATFTAARLDWERRSSGDGAAMLALYRDLLAARRDHPTLHAAGTERVVERVGDLVTVTSRGADETTVAAFNFGAIAARVEIGNSLEEAVVVIEGNDEPGDRPAADAVAVGSMGFALLAGRQGAAQ